MQNIKNSINPLIAKLKDKFQGKASREKISVGLDIGTSAIKIAKLKFLGENIELCGFYLEPTGVDLALLLKEIAQSQNLNSVNISVAGSSVIIRYALFPSLNDEELKQSLKFEAQKHIPFSISDVNLDGSILKHGLPENKMLVLLAAVKKEFLSQRLKVIEEAGLKVNLVDMDSLALINAFKHAYSEEESLQAATIALLNIGAAISNLNILENGIPRLSRDINIAGNNFTQKIQDALNLDFKSAEELKINPDKDKLDKLIMPVETVLSNLVNEVRVSFDYYESQSASSVGEIFLSGAGGLFPGLKEMLANMLGVKVEYWDPLKRISISSGVDAEKIKQLSGRLPVAIGLALRF